MIPVLLVYSWRRPPAQVGDSQITFFRAILLDNHRGTTAVRAAEAIISRKRGIPPWRFLSSKISWKSRFVVVADCDRKTFSCVSFRNCSLMGCSSKCTLRTRRHRLAGAVRYRRFGTVYGAWLSTGETRPRETYTKRPSITGDWASFKEPITAVFILTSGYGCTDGEQLGPRLRLPEVCNNERISQSRGSR